MGSSPDFFGITYYRPWDENANLLDSWCDYLKDVGVAKYNADLIGSHLREALDHTANQINGSIEKQTEAIQEAARGVNLELGRISDELYGVNQRLSLSLEQQRLSNFLLKDIAELLKIPDSEKERQQAISHGVSFLVKASVDEDLYDDALAEFTKAYQLMPQDYFVLHRLGLIYMYAPKHIDLQKAADFFLRAAKYAFVDSDEELRKIAETLSLTGGHGDNSQVNPKEIVADSYDKAALALYCLGNDISASKYQEKSVNLSASTERLFNQAKYLYRCGNVEKADESLREAIVQKPVMMSAAFSDPDIISHKESLAVINGLKNELDGKYGKLLQDLSVYSSDSDECVIEELQKAEEGKSFTYTEKLEFYKQLLEFSEKIKRRDSVREKISSLKAQILDGDYYFPREKDPEFSSTKTLSEIIQELDVLHEENIYEIETKFNEFQAKFESYLLKPGYSCEGGRVVWLNAQKNGGLIVSTKPYSTEYPGLRFRSLNSDVKRIERYRALGEDIGDGFTRTVFVAQNLSDGKDTAAYYMYTKHKFQGYDDWFIPTMKEINDAPNLRPYAINDIEIGHRLYTDYYWYNDGRIILGDGLYSDYLYPVRTFGKFCEELKKDELQKPFDENRKEYVLYETYERQEKWKEKKKKILKGTLLSLPILSLVGVFVIVDSAGHAVLIPIILFFLSLVCLFIAFLSGLYN